MNFEDYLLYIIENYVENEIEYKYDAIKQEENLVYYDTTCDKEDLEYLENLTNNDFLNILHNILTDTDIQEIIYESIHDKLYDYKIEKGEKNEE